MLVKTPVILGNNAIVSLRSAKSLLRRNQSGQTIWEFSVLAPIILLMLVGVIEFASGIYTYSEVAYSASAAARWASVRGSTYSCSTCTPTGPAKQSDISTYVLGFAEWSASNQPTVTATWTPVGCQVGQPNCTGSCQNNATNCPGSTVQVTVQTNFQLGVPLMKTVTLPLTSTTQMVISQ